MAEDLLTSIHIEEYEIDARETKLGPEEITRDPERRRGRGGQPRRATASSASAPRSVPATSWSARSRRRARASSDRRGGACCAPSSERRPTRSATPPLKMPHGAAGIVIEPVRFSRENGDELARRQRAGAVYVAQPQDQQGDKIARPPRQQGCYL